MMTPAEKRHLFQKAHEAGFTSVAAYLRRKMAAPDALSDADLDAFAAALRSSTARANAALDRTIAGMQEYRAQWGGEAAKGVRA